MPKPYKLHSTRPLPSDADIVERDGRPHVCLQERGKAVLYPLTRDGAKYLRPSKRWYFDVRDAAGTVHRTKGFADFKATEQLAAEAERKVARVRAGIVDPNEDHLRRPLADHLRDYAAHLEAKGNTPTHNRATVAKVNALLTGCGFVFSTDVQAGKVSAWLVDLRRPGRIPDLPPGELFRPPEAAQLLGIGTDALRRFVARHRLPTVGNGPARRLPRPTVLAVAERVAQGNGPATVNHYVRAVQGFFRWLAKEKRIGSDPLDSLPLLNEAVDVRRGRRELTGAELESLLRGTRGSGRTFRGLSGGDRFMLYLTAAATGFRAGALARLTPGDFDLDPAGPLVTLPARYNKSRKAKVQPIPADVADALREYLAGKPANAPVWGGTWVSGCAAAEMMRRDLEAVGIPYAVEGPDGPLYVDFHALRHTYLTMLGRHGVDLRTAQELAGHSTPQLTARYSHRRLYDLQGAVEKMPNLVPRAEEAGAVPLRLTGTEAGVHPSERGVSKDKDLGAVRAVVPGVVTGGAGRHLAASGCTFGSLPPTAADSPQPLETTGAGTSRHRPASSRTKLPGLDSNQDKESQNLLCYRYTTG